MGRRSCSLGEVAALVLELAILDWLSLNLPCLLLGSRCGSGGLSCRGLGGRLQGRFGRYE